MKKYCALIHAQPVLEAVTELRRRHDLSADDVASVTCETFQGAFEIAGGGSFGSKDHPTTKEQADYNLKYLIAVALLDGQVGPAQLDEQRVNAPDVQALLYSVEIKPNPRFTQAYPDQLQCRIVIHSGDGRDHTKTQIGYEGGRDRPLTWERVTEKFNWLSEPFADAGLRKSAITAVQSLDLRPISHLTSLLAQ